MRSFLTPTSFIFLPFSSTLDEIFFIEESEFSLGRLETSFSYPPPSKSCPPPPACSVEVASDMFSVADGNHFHSSNGGAFGNGQDLIEVGEFSSETVKGMAEFDLANSIGPVAVASVTCRIHLRGGLFGGSNNFIANDFPVDVLTYEGNNSEDLGDFTIPTTALVGSFSTAGMNVGDEVCFDVTDQVNDLLNGEVPALGIRMETSVGTNDGAISLEQCLLALGYEESCPPTDPPTAEPTTADPETPGPTAAPVVSPSPSPSASPSNSPSSSPTDSPSSESEGVPALSDGTDAGTGAAALPGGAIAAIALVAVAAVLGVGLFALYKHGKKADGSNNSGDSSSDSSLSSGDADAGNGNGSNVEEAA